MNWLPHLVVLIIGIGIGVIYGGWVTDEMWKQMERSKSNAESDDV